MRRRLVVGLLAALLAIAGTVLIVNYVQGADSRAMAGQQLTSVLVVTKDVPMGTAGKDLNGYVEVRQLPKTAVVDGSIPDLASVPQTKVTSTTLKTGEQVLAARFVDPNSDELTTQVALPTGMQQLSIQLEPQRVVGATLKAGDLVGIYLSIAAKNATAGSDISTTDVIAHKVLVLRAQGAVQPQAATSASTTADKMPSNSVIVTVAVDSTLAERIVFGQEYGKLWLTQEKADSTTTTKPVTAGNVFVR